MSSTANHLSAWDYAVFGVMLAFSAGIGVYYKFAGDRQRTTKEYLLANKEMSSFPVAVSLMASFMSAISMLGNTAEMYMYGTQFIWINLSYALCTPVAAYIFLPVFYELRVTSVYEYLELRFNRKVRVTASLVFMVSMIVYMSIVLYAPALALSAVTGISRWYAIITIGLVCTVYCTIGGIKAVLWTDVFQAGLMLLAMVIVIVKGSIDVGGLDVVFKRASEGHRLEFFNISPNPLTRHTIWSLALGGTFVYASLYGINQTQVQRLLTVKTLKKARIALYLSWPMTSLISVASCLSGLVIYAYFWQCDPLSDHEITKSDQLLPYFVITSLTKYPGLSGLIISGLFSGSLSSVSSFVNSCAAVTLEDYVKPLFTKERTLSERTESIAVKSLAFGYGLLCIALTVVVEQVDGLLQAALTIFGVVGGPLLGLFTAGICFRSPNAIGSLIGFIISLALGCWIGFGSIFLGDSTKALPMSTADCNNNISMSSLSYAEPYSDKSDTLYVYNISYMWLAFMTWFVGLGLALILSQLIGEKSVVEERLLAPVFRKNVSEKGNTL